MVGPSVISARLHLYLVAFLVSSVGGSMAPARASAVGYTLGFELHEPAPTRFGQFGFAVALVGNDMLVGAPGTEDFGPARPGAAYLFDGTTGALRHTFTRPVASERDTFGFAVAAVGSTIAIAAPSDGTAGDEAGAVYVFDAGTGALIRTLLSPNPVDEGYFGWSVAAVGSNLMVGARNDLIYGAAYLFDGATGALLRTFLNPTPGAGSLFGWSVAAVGANVAVGAPGGLPGAAHLFDAASGALLQSFVSPVQGEEEQFGFAVAGVGPDVLVGAVFNDTGGEDAGTAYLFDGATGALRRTFPNPTPASPDYYGWAVGEIGGDVLVSSIEDRLGDGAGGGTVYRFDATTGAVLETIRGFPDDIQFGWSIATNETRLLVGANLTQEPVPGAGGAYLLSVCGDGLRGDGEQCDDGNATGGDGCSATCRLERCGAVPLAGCRRPTVPGGSVVQLRNLVTRVGDHRRDRLVWKWNHGAATTLADFGDPRASASYVLCLYDGSAAPQPKATFAAPAAGVCEGGPCWEAKGETGFGYGDARATPDGLRVLRLKAGAEGRPRISAIGSGPHLGLGSMPQGAVTVQLANTETGVCWEATYSSPYRSDGAQYAAKSD